MFVKRERMADGSQDCDRSTGMSMRRIASLLGVSVSSVSRWTRDIELTPCAAGAPDCGQSALQRAAAGTGKAGADQPERSGSDRAAGTGEWTRSTGRPTSCTWLHALLGGGVEESKRRGSHELRSRPSDCVRPASSAVLLVPDAKLALLGELSSRQRTGAWRDRGVVAGATEASRDGAFEAATVNRSFVSVGSAPRSCARRTERRACAPYCVHVVQSIYGAIQEYAGIERPEWLD